MRKNYIYHKLIILLILVIIPLSKLIAQKKNQTYVDYIEKYKSTAIKDMKDYKIPASITLAQGILESGAGQSSLTKKSNNHFGIKCHDWKGKTVYAKDDGPNDCFRKYDNAADSYADHSKFLSEKPRYKPLFDLKITDYKAWAKGLQKCGYATDKAYANRLITIIELYELYQYDSAKGKKEKVKKQDKNIPKTYNHTPYKTGGLVYIIAKDGDSYESIANEFGFDVDDLCKWNEVPKDFPLPLQKGDLVYFQKKKSKADKPYYEHVIQVGESMYSISQIYGIKVKNLYKMNKIKMDDDYIPTEGDVLKLR